MPRKETYKVVGAAPINGHAPGEEFEATEDEVAFALEIGGVEKVERKPEKKDPDRERRRT